MTKWGGASLSLGTTRKRMLGRTKSGVDASLSLGTTGWRGMTEKDVAPSASEGSLGAYAPRDVRAESFIEKNPTC
jgi:hypothetical protein